MPKEKGQIPCTGMLLIDKPTGMTSHDVVAIVRKKLGVKKVGHAGTLDPLATGLLIILVGREYTKRQAEFMEGEKVYTVTGKLGVLSDTYDIEGKILGNRQEPARNAQPELLRKPLLAGKHSVAGGAVGSKIRKKSIEELLPQFTGKIQQRVPAFSAVKVKGKKLYEKARKGKIKESELPVRQVEITQIDLLSLKKNNKKQEAFFSLRVRCSKGTYIRSLVHDIGQELEFGAVVTELRREKSGNFDVKDAISIDQISENSLLH